MFIQSLLLGIFLGFLYGFLFVWEKKKTFSQVRDGKKFALLSAGVFFRYLLLFSVIYFLVSRYEFSLLVFLGGYLGAFWLYLLSKSKM